MHVLLVIVGAIAGAWLAQGGRAFFGIVAGMVVASLLFRHSRLSETIRKLNIRIDHLDATVSRLSRDEDEQRPVTPRVSIHEPQPAPEREPETRAEPASEAAPASRVPLASAVPASEVAAEPASKPAPRPPVTPPRHAPTRRSPDPFERLTDHARRWLTTGNVPVKVGIILSFFGVGFLLKYAVDKEILFIPVWSRYVGVAAFAAVLLALGWRLRDRQRVYALSLQGGGVGVLFLTVFAAFRLHMLLPPSVAFVLLVFVTAAAGILAVLQESRALAILGTTGGFLAPLLVSTGSGNHVALFGYYLVLNGAVLGVAWYRAWRELNIIGFVFTFGAGVLWGYQYYRPELFASTEPFLIAYFLFYTAIAVLFAFRQPPQLRGLVDGTLVFGTPTIAFALQHQLVDDTEYGLAISAIVVAVFYAALALWLHRSQGKKMRLLSQSFLALGVGFATIAIPLAFDDRWTAIAWALEGAALVWVGTRQHGTMAKLTGMALPFASGAAYMNHGWASDLGIPVLNGNYLGGALIAAASVFVARLLRTESKADEWQALASPGLLLYGLAWWYGAGVMEIADRGPGDAQLHLALLFFSASFAACAYAARKLAWVALRNSALAFLPLLPIIMLGYLLEHEHFLEGVGWAGWIAAGATHLWILRCLGKNTRMLAELWHGIGLLLFTGLVVYEVYWQLDQVVRNQVWAASASLLVLALAPTALIAARDRISWPVSEYMRAYYAAAAIVILTYLMIVFTISVDRPGDPSPLPYIPVLNPFDVLTIAGLAVAWYLIRIAHAEKGWLVDEGHRGSLFAWGGTAFVLSTLAVIRAVHHFADVPWDDHALFDSVGVQSTLSIYWAVLGLTGMILGTRKGNRTFWMIGVALMSIVVAKLFVVDLGNTGTVARIVSFLGVGVMLLIVGYFSPAPPRRADPEAS